VTLRCKDVWEDDSVEVHVDPDFSRGKAYDGENDIQYIVPRGADEIHPGANSITDTTGVEFAQAETEDGWRLELCIPWPLFDVDPEVGHELGTDVHVNDGVERDAKVAWYTDVDESWKRPELFGPVQLGECRPTRDGRFVVSVPSVPRNSVVPRPSLPVAPELLGPAFVQLTGHLAHALLEVIVIPDEPVLEF